MYVIDKASHDGTYLCVVGWCFKSSTKLLGAIAEIGTQRISLQGFGLLSNDVAQHYGEDARNARFEFKIATSQLSCVIEFEFSDATIARAQISTAKDTEKLTALKHRIHNGLYKGVFSVRSSNEIKSVHFLAGTDAPEQCSEPIPFTLRKDTDNEDQILKIEKQIPEDWDTQDLGILIKTSDETLCLTSIPNHVRSRDESHQIGARFFERLCQSPNRLRVIEIGSRARSGIIRKHQFGKQNEYIGFDILEGPNVDVVGDIHALSKSFPPSSIDAIAGFSVFEHVAMPWKAAIEINKVLKIGGLCMFHTHQTWPVHESPYDFWRFSTDSWRAIFNKSSGFRIIDSACGGAATIHPLIQASRSDAFEESPGYTSSSVLVEKTGETKLSWDVDMDEIHLTNYPA